MTHEISIHAGSSVLLKARLTGEGARDGPLSLEDIATGTRLSTDVLLSALIDSDALDALISERSQALTLRGKWDRDMRLHCILDGVRSRVEVSDHVGNIYDADNVTLHEMIGLPSLR